MTAPRIPRRASTYIPAGADQQGRHVRTGCFIQAAEAANDIGAEDAPDFRRRAMRALVFWLLLTALAVGLIAGTIWHGTVGSWVDIVTGGKP